MGAAQQYNIPEATAQLSRIIERVEQGNEVVISRTGKPVAKAVPLRPYVKRTGRGSLRGKLVPADDWDSPETNAAIAADFTCATPAPLIHPCDPFDRMLVAQAQCEGLTLVTRDTEIQKYDVSLLRV